MYRFFCLTARKILTSIIPQDRLQIHIILLIFVVHFPARDFFRYYYIRVKALHEYPENNLRIPLT